MAADLGCWLMLPSVFGTAETFVPIVEVYRERWEASGRDWADAKVGACSHIHVGRETQAARTYWSPFYQNYWEFVGTLLAGKGTWPPFDLDTMLAGPGICGSPAFVVERIEMMRETLSLDRHLVMFDLGGIDTEALFESIELFGAEVIPQLNLA